MKNILSKIILSSAAAFTMFACSDDWTDLESEYGVTYDNFYKTEEDAVKAVNSIYDYMDDEDMFARGYFWFIHASDDMVTGRPNGNAEKIRNFNPSADGYIYWMYPQSYKVIRRCNDVILNIPKIKFETEGLQDRIIGEAIFMRAFHYFWLAHTYGDNGQNGGVPIITEENMNDPAGSYTRPESVIQNYEQIISDLERAAELLPYVTEYSSDDLGRPHKDAAWAYIAKTYMYWAQYDSSKWEKVIEYTNKVINSPSGRKLVDTDHPKEDYRRLHSYLENWGTEYIWSVNSGLDGGSKLPGVMLERSGWGKYNGWGYYMPTKELYDAYEDGDIRRDVTILAWGDKFPYFGDTITYKSGNSTSGYQFNKYMYEYGMPNPNGTYINNNGHDPTTLYNVPLLRFAEVLLMKAEAKLMLGQNADEEINLVRDRAGVKKLTNATMDDLKHERRVEFAGEFANRHFDLVRWGDAKEAYAKPSHGNPASSNVPADGVIWPARNFDPSYMHVWPIPDEIVRNTGIKQNHGW